MTAHKTQSITLPSMNIHLNKQFFAPGHAYVGLSRPSKWSDVQISDLDPAAFRVDHAVIAEYTRLNELHNRLTNIVNS